MDRRFFLKACAAIGGTSLVAIPAIELLLPETLIRPDQSWIGNVRELTWCEAFTERQFVRHDIAANGGVQLCVTSVLPDARDPASLVFARQGAADVLGREMAKRGIRVRDLCGPLPVPAGWA